MRRHIMLNGKFLSAAPTGVHRVAEELGNALAALVAEGHPEAKGLELSLKIPRNGYKRAHDMTIPAECVSPMVSIAWEQLTLPMRKGKGVLLNLCNIGPVLSRDSVTMIHDVQVRLSPSSYRMGFRLWYHFVQPIIARRHRGILTVSEFSRQEIIKARLAPPERVAVIHNGVDHILRVEPDDSVWQRLGLAPRTYVVALANAQAHKNIRILLKAFARPELADLTLVLFGGTPCEAFEEAGLEIPENVVFAGRVSDGQMRGLIEQALCLAFPSTTEGFGLPPLEAMLLGCPAVVAPCGAVPEVCGEGALYADPDKDDEWAARIDQLRRNDEAYSTLVTQGRKQAESFTWRRAAVSLAQVLSTI